MSRSSRRTLVSHKLRPFNTGDAEVDRHLDEQLRDHTAQTFEKLRYFDKYTRDNEITSAETDALVTPTNYTYSAGEVLRYGSDYTAIVNALAQAAQSGGVRLIKLAPTTSYDIGANTIALPNNVSLDMNGSGITTTAPTVMTFGDGSTLWGGEGAYLVSGGASGSALKKTSTSSGRFNVYGWPSLFATSLGTAGSVGLNATYGYKGIFEISVEGYQTNIQAGDGNTGHATYYNEIRAPRVTCTSGQSGIVLLAGCNATLISHPQVNGGGAAIYGIYADGIAGLTVLGGYLEGFLDNDTTRGIYLNAAGNVTYIGTTCEIAASTAANFAIGITGVNDNLNFFGLSFAGAWANSAKIMSMTGTGNFNFHGGSPSNQVMYAGQSTFNSGEANGTIRGGPSILTGPMSLSTSAAAGTAGSFINTGDGVGGYFENNSSNKTAARPAILSDRAGGPGYVLASQIAGAASAGGIVACTGTPEAQITAVVGTMALRTDGGAGTTLYIKETGTGNTGWVAK